MFLKVYQNTPGHSNTKCLYEKMQSNISACWLEGSGLFNCQTAGRWPAWS